MQNNLILRTTCVIFIDIQYLDFNEDNREGERNMDRIKAEGEKKLI